MQGERARNESGREKLRVNRVVAERPPLRIKQIPQHRDVWQKEECNKQNPTGSQGVVKKQAAGKESGAFEAEQ